MSSIPLPALAVQAPQQPDILSQLSKLQALKQMQGQQQIQQQTIQANQQEMQQRQQQISDQQAMTKSMQEWDGKNLEDLPSLILKNGGSANAVFSTKQQIVAQKEKLSTIAKDDATTGATNLKTLQDKNDMLLGKLQTVTDGPSLIKATQDAVQQGLLDPQHAQVAAQLAQLPPDQLKQQLSVFEKSLMGQKAQFDQAQKERETAATELKAQTEAKRLQLEQPGGALESPGVADNRYRTIKQNQALGQTVSAQDQAFLTAYDQQKKAAQPYGAARVEIAQEGVDLRKEEAGRKDRDFIDKTYVKPANDTEKSYQMFMDAYNNRNNAKTGAESMLALSTHLATTFGNVKGSRVTKDMIQEHLGARGISDSALAAVQKLTNGDVLSPDQWDAFKDLISQSRKLSWDTVQKEAARRSVDVSGSVPKDLSSPAGGTSDPFAAFGGKAKQ